MFSYNCLSCSSWPAVPWPVAQLFRQRVEPRGHRVEPLVERVVVQQLAGRALAALIQPVAERSRFWWSPVRLSASAGSFINWPRLPSPFRSLSGDGVEVGDRRVPARRTAWDRWSACPACPCPRRTALVTRSAARDEAVDLAVDGVVGEQLADGALPGPQVLRSAAWLRSRPPVALSVELGNAADRGARLARSPSPASACRSGAGGDVDGALAEQRNRADGRRATRSVTSGRTSFFDVEPDLDAGAGEVDLARPCPSRCRRCAPASRS